MAERTPEPAVPTETGEDKKIRKPAFKLSVSAGDMLEWLGSRPERPLNSVLISSFGPKYLRSGKMRSLALTELEKQGLIAVETSRARDKGKLTRMISLVEQAQ